MCEGKKKLVSIEIWSVIRYQIAKALNNIIARKRSLIILSAAKHRSFDSTFPMIVQWMSIVNDPMSLGNPIFYHD